MPRSELDELLHQSAAEIRALQAARLRQIVRHAYDTAPFWRRRLDDAGIDPNGVASIRDLASLPPLEKSDFRERLEDLASTAYRQRRSSATTGGSTAAPMLFYRDADCVRYREDVRSQYWMQLGRSPREPWVNVWGARQDYVRMPRIKQWLMHRLKRRMLLVPANQLRPKDVPVLAARIRRYRPKLLHGYSQAVYLLARCMLEQGLRPPAGLRAVSCTAEPLFEQQKSCIEQAFHCPAFRVYGTREFGFLAFEMPNRHGLQVHPGNAVIEIVNRHGQPAGAGETGSILVTDLWNRAAPFLRYRIGDLGAWAVPPGDEVGWPVLSISAGRETDFVVGEEGRFIGGAALTLIAAPGVEQLQFVQDRAGELTVRYVSGHKLPAESLAILEAKVRGVVGNLRIECQAVDEIKTAPSGKLQYVVSSVSRSILGGEEVLGDRE
jgi:phenylacetate-CoA ligase